MAPEAAAMPAGPTAGKRPPRQANSCMRMDVYDDHKERAGRQATRVCWWVYARQVDLLHQQD
eukprot:1151892-Pelagomonas_calceolata.AAC.1